MLIEDCSGLFSLTNITVKNQVNIVSQNSTNVEYPSIFTVSNSSLSQIIILSVQTLNNTQNASFLALPSP